MIPSPKTFENLRVALVHHWLLRMRGGERVLEALCKIFPQADIYTLVFKPAEISEIIKGHRITTSWIQKLPGATRHHERYLPLFPLAVEQFQLNDYDLVISSDASVAKGVLTLPETCHICYCHSPIRYAWSAYSTYLHSIQGSLRRAFFSLIMSYLRSWDVSASQRVDYFVANSQNVAHRIRKYYRREAAVIYPPISRSQFLISNEHKDYYLAVGHLAPYKRFDLAVDAFTRSKRPLWIVGEGPEHSRLKRSAGKNIRFLGRTSDAELKQILNQCRALIFPGEEDFGMIIPEAHACGRPVIALAKGGALETVIPELNGLFFDEETVDSLDSAVMQFEAMESRFYPVEIRSSGEQFSEERFSREMIQFVSENFEEHRLRFRSTIQTSNLSIQN